VFPPKEVSATKCPDLVELEKEIFGLRLKAMELDACQHKILNLQVIVFEKDSYINTLEKDLLEANAERIRLSTECETANSCITSSKIKFASLQERFIIQKFQSEIERNILQEDRIKYRRTLVNQDVQISLLRKKVHDFENLCTVDSDDDEEILDSHHRVSDPKPFLDPKSDYDFRVFLEENDDPSGFFPKKREVHDPKNPSSISHKETKECPNPSIEYNSRVFLEPRNDPSGLIPEEKASVPSKPERSPETPVPGSEINKPEGAKCDGTDKGTSGTPDTPTGLQN